MKKTYYVAKGQMSGQLYKVSVVIGFTGVSKVSEATQFSSIPDLTRGVQAASKIQKDNFYLHIVRVEETPGTEIPGKETREVVVDHKAKERGAKYAVHVGQSYIRDTSSYWGQWTVDLKTAKLYDTLPEAIKAFEAVNEPSYNGLAVSFERVKVTKEPATVTPPFITETVLS